MQILERFDKKKVYAKFPAGPLRQSIIHYLYPDANAAASATCSEYTPWLFRVKGILGYILYSHTAVYTVHKAPKTNLSDIAMHAFLTPSSQFAHILTLSFPSST